MDKRLEEIKEAYRLSHKEIGAYVNSEGIEYLIQQAERVQELETSRKEIAASFAETWQQNQRYKQALEEVLFEAYEEAGTHPDTGLQMDTWITRRIEQTLKGVANG
ncbi:hypothetical protein JUJ52_08730 [Virgibacillus sp. AGTR]|uniref:hypothetical protein n=1 Tax=Virgibacillus sp. AGTR TaxID=2812055 RepID=UPI001D161480|nr:hypothetical protein [Virgibacillus sp. AGTR]MCC2250050.1 hypothetical protein [Virgibacillus sp. AGTR]